MFKLFATYSLLILLLAACGTNKKLTSAIKKTSAAKQAIVEDSTKLGKLQTKTVSQLSDNAIDSVLKNEIFSVITKLQNDLSKIEETVTAIELITQKKSTIKGKKYYARTQAHISKIDSFQDNKKMRDRIYQMLNEAVNMNAFHKYEMGAFFETGAFKIPLTAIDKLKTSFQPAIDSIIHLADKYTDVKRKIYIVFVGFADAQSISPGAPLYKELSSYIPNIDKPNRQQLNLMLSSLRSSELLRNMKDIMLDNSTRLSSINKLKISYVHYGRGESLPFQNIKDYKDNDERRRVVVFYWSILPDL